MGKLAIMKSIENEKEYEDALARAYALLQQDLLPDSKESDELKSIALVIEEYEKTHYPMHNS